MGILVKRVVAATAIAGAAAGGVLAGTGEAQARVASGSYTLYVSTVIGGTQATPARVQGNVLTTYSGRQVARQRIIPTRSGGYIDTPMAGRMTLVKGRGGTYFGRVYMVGIPSGDLLLRPRR